MGFGFKCCKQRGQLKQQVSTGSEQLETLNAAFVLFKMWCFKSWLLLVAEEHRQAATEN